MDWLILSILNAFIFAVVSILDSHLLSRRLPGIGAYFLPVFFTATLGCIAGLSLASFPADTPLYVIVFAVTASVVRTAGYAAMMIAFKRMEVSKVVPVVFTYPVFVAIMAVFLLGETLNFMQWLAIVLVVGGAVMVSFRGNAFGEKAGKKFLILLGISLSIAVSDVLSKFVLGYIEFWNMFSINMGVLAIAALTIMLFSSGYKQMRQVEKPHIAIFISVFGQAIAYGGLILQLLALQRGPVSLVSTVVSSRPIFVLIIALIISRVYPVLLVWEPGVRALVLKIVATAMIFAGIAMIYLT